MKAVHAVTGLFLSLAVHGAVIGIVWLVTMEKPEEEEETDPGQLTVALAEPPPPSIEEELIEEQEAFEEEVAESEPIPEPLEETPIEETLVEVEPEPVIEEEALAEAVLEEFIPPGDATEEPAEADATEAIEATLAEAEPVTEPDPATEATELAEAENGGKIEDILGGADSEPERAVVAEGTSLAGGEFAAPKVVLSFASPSELFQAATRHNMYLFGVDSLHRGVVQISRDGRTITEHRGPIRVSGAWSSVPLEIEIAGSRDLRSHFGASWNPRVRRVIAVMPSALARQIGSVQEQQLRSLGLEPEQVETIHMAVSPDPSRPAQVLRVIKR